MSSKQLVRDYSRFRQAGWHAATALRAVRTCAEFAALESLGLVRLVASEEVESYFDVFGEPEGYTDGNGKRVSAEAERQELVRSFERDGVWHVGSQWRTSEADEWRPAAGVGMCAEIGRAHV